MRSLLVSCSFAAVALLGSSTALAYERQWHAGASAGYIGGWNGLGHGFGFGVDVGYGVRDWLDLVGAIDASFHPSSKTFLPTAAVGARVAYDNLQVVPHIGLLVGVGLPTGIEGCKGGCLRPSFDLAIPFGADYQLSRKWTIGLAGRFQLFVGKGGATPLMGAFFKVQYLWGY